MKLILGIITCLLLSSEVKTQLPRVYIMNAERLVEVKEKLLQQDETVLHLFNFLKKQADDLLPMKPVSVMDKAFTAVSGNRHDYMSQAPYFWYDSSKPNGLPYLRKDGVRNPEINKITDHKSLDELENAARILSLTWYFTGEEKYAEKAAGLLRYWFLEEATLMNPNLDYAQAIPGINTGRGIGIIETRSLTGIADAVALLQSSQSWSGADTKSLQQWYSQFLKWLLTSKNGKEEHVAKNNHGTWFYAQAIDFALFTGDNATAKQLVEESKKRLDSQLTKEGKQPLELERTNALGYSTMNLNGWFSVAKLAEKTGVDLWNYQTPQHASLNTALEWLLPYALGEKPWSYQQISKYNKNELYPILLQAATGFKEKKYSDAGKVLNKQDNLAIIDLLYGR